jgi:hypothetical protein
MRYAAAPLFPFWKEDYFMSDVTSKIAKLLALAQSPVEIGFVGLEEDFAACKLAFCYAHGSVMARCGEIKKQYKGIYPPGDIRQMCHSYSRGFCSGLSEAFTSQSQEHLDWGLVMVVPKATANAPT